jgi:hypothetical protein
VVAGLILPDLSGAQLYQRLIETDEAWSKRFLFVTGADAREPWVRTFISTLRSRVLFKPVEPDDIRRVVGRRLDLLRA